MRGQTKVRATHLDRTAVIYVRQSTLAQVREHTESTMRQYALAEEATRLGWAADAVEVIDADLGVSGRSVEGRDGFKALVARVCLGEIGAVFGLEISRLASDGTLQGIHLVPALVILCREILVSGLREFLAQLQVSVPVTRLSKWKTTLQMIAIGFLVVGNEGPELFGFTSTDGGVCGLWAAAALTLVTGYDYLRAGLHHVGAERTYVKPTPIKPADPARDVR